MHAQVHPLSADLGMVVGADNMVEDQATLACYRRDKSPFPDMEPGVVVKPGTVDEVSAVLELANQYGAPVIARGGGFSLTGFPRAAPGKAIVLDMRRLNRILEINKTDMIVTAECGALMSDLDAAVDAHGLQVHTVMVPIHYTTLGGVLSGVVGGGIPRDNAVVGSNVHHLLGLKLVLPDGSVLDTNAGGSNVHRQLSTVQDGDGSILTPLFVGDAGVLGVKVAATLQLTPAAPLVEAGHWVFPNFDGVWQALLRLTAIRESPYTILNASEGPPWSLGFVSTASDPRLLAWQVETVTGVLQACGGRPGLEADCERMREMAVPGGRWTDRFINVDRALLAAIFSKSDFVDAYRRIRDLLNARFRERKLADIGLALRVHFTPHTRHAIYTTISILYDESVPEGRAAAQELATEGYQLIVDLGGYSEPHQGAASQLLAREWSPQYRQLMSTLKSTLDPKNILNPGLWNHR